MYYFDPDTCRCIPGGRREHAEGKEYRLVDLVAYPAYDPGSRTFYCIEEYGVTANLLRYDLTTCRKEVLLSEQIRTTPKGAVPPPALSPDGQKLAFSMGGWLCVYDVAAGELTKLRRLHRPDSWVTFAWGPDSARLCFDDEGLECLDLATGESLQIDQHGFLPIWSWPRDSIIFERYRVATRYLPYLRKHPGLWVSEEMTKWRWFVYNIPTGATKEVRALNRFGWVEPIAMDGSGKGMYFRDSHVRPIAMMESHVYYLDLTTLSVKVFAKAFSDEDIFGIGEVVEEPNGEESAVEGRAEPMDSAGARPPDERGQSTPG